MYPMTFYMIGLALFGMFLIAVRAPYQGLILVLVAPYVQNELTFGILVFFSIISWVLGGFTSRLSDK